MVDIDPAEISKMRTPIHVPIRADASAFLRELLSQAPKVRRDGWPAWRSRCADWKHRYPIVLPMHRELPNHSSMYHFSEVLSEEMAEGCHGLPTRPSGQVLCHQQ
jgi:acetolactate synthase-1/2/3 large subunit